MRMFMLILILSCGFFVSAQETDASVTHQEVLSLQQAIDYAIANNVQTQNASLDIEIAKQQVRETIAQGLPQINANLDYDYYLKQPVSLIPGEVFGGEPGTQIPVTFGTKQNFAAGIQWQQLLFSGSYLVGLQSAKAFKQISELGKEKTDEQITEAVINAYSGVLVAQENQGIVNKNLQVANRNLYEIEEIYKAGFAEEQSVDQIKYTNKQLETTLAFAQRQEKIALDALKYIIGMEQSTHLTLSTPIEEVMTEDLALLQDITDEKLAEHIDYRLAENQVKTGVLQVKYQKTFALPTLSAFLNHSYNENGNEFIFFTDDKTTFQTTLLGFRMQIPIFSGFERSARTQQAKLKLQQAELKRDNTKQELIQKAKQAKLEYENALDNYETNQELVRLSQSIYDKEKIKFFEGLSTSTELATAENQLYQSENQLIQAMLQVVSAKTALNQALGNY